MKKLKETLAFLGFSDSEINLYLKLLYLKESTASNLGKELKIHRRSAYDVAERLVKKGLLTFMEKNGVKYYKPLAPLQLLDMLEDKEKQIKEKKIELSKLLPKIEELISEQRVDAQILFGKEGIKTMYLDELKEGKTIHIICTVIDRT
jgi:sugar-specific transcriptional regulator TrmB